MVYILSLTGIHPQTNTPEVARAGLGTDRSSMSTIQLQHLLDDDVVLEWRDLAACIGHDPSMFFPAGETGRYIRTLPMVSADSRI